MEEKIEKALETLLDQVRSNLKPADAVLQAEAILKMAQAKQLLMPTQTATKKTGTGA